LLMMAGVGNANSGAVLSMEKRWVTTALAF
jgi:hypothetical protein